MPLRRKKSQRLAVSTGDDKSTGAKGSYVRKLRNQEAKASAKGKSAEEKRLEEEIFGADYTGAASDEDLEGHEADLSLDWLAQQRSKKLKLGNAEDTLELDNEAEELNHLADHELFMLDEPAASTSKILDQPPSSDETASEHEDDEADENEQEYDDDHDDNDNEAPEDENVHPTYASLKGKEPAKKKSLWTDEADENLTVSLQGVKRLRKLRAEAGEDTVSGAEYEQKLRQQFQKIHPAPSWATKARANTAKTRDDSDEEDREQIDGEIDGDLASLQKILHKSSAGLKQSYGIRKALPSGDIELHRLRDANQVERDNKSAITALDFHPTAQVLFTTSEDRRLKLYQIDGTVNPLLQSIHTPDLPITNAAFHPSGSSVLLTGRRPFFFSYDLQSGRIIRSPRGLWSSGLGGSDGDTNDVKGGGLETFAFSPDGRYVAMAGRRGYVHLLDWGVDGKGLMAGGNGGQTVGHVKINSGISGLAWRSNGAELVTVGDDASVYLWDVGSRKCIQRWSDDGGFGPSYAAGDRQERFFAVGSRSGIVNLYDANRAFATEQPDSQARKPVKTIMNLTTNVTSIRFNHSSELLAVASRSKKDSLKLVHLPSNSIISNWPTSGTPLGHVSGVSFSRASEYMAVGNHKGRVLLYSLAHYNRL